LFFSALEIFTDLGLVTKHSPMGVNNWANWNSQYTKQVLMQKKEALFTVQDGVNITTFRGGKARGRLIGGNLSVFSSMVGSKYLPTPESLTDAIVFLEEVEEYPYRVDRMLTTMHLGGWFDHVAAVVFGRCTSCNDPNPPGQGFSFMEVLRQRFAPLNVPSFYGAMFGHISEMYVLPVGGLVEIDADKGTIQMLEPAVA
jgi:muramoyltetrapeptide carboxypeptidase